MKWKSYIFDSIKGTRTIESFLFSIKGIPTPHHIPIPSPVEGHPVPIPEPSMSHHSLPFSGKPRQILDKSLAYQASANETEQSFLPPNAVASSATGRPSCRR